MDRRSASETNTKGEEMFSDSYKYTIKNDFFYEVDGKNVKKGAEDVSNINIGANPSQEEQQEACDESGTEQSGCNIVLAHRLQPTGFDKKAFMSYLKDYMKVLCEKIEADKGKEAADEFKKRAQENVKSVIIPNFKDWDFYLGESGNPDGTVALLNYREDGETPYMLFFKDGVIAEKY